jgi:hypothetical protein
VRLLGFAVRGRLRLRALAFAVVVGAALLAGSTVAQARAPILESVGATDGHATVTWSLPSGVQSRFVEISTTRTTNKAGYFTPQGNVKSFSTLLNDQTSFTDTFRLTRGTYYLHIAGEDVKHRDCPVREFSTTMALVVQSDGSGSAAGDVGGGSPACPSSGGGGGGGGGGSDKVPPSFRTLIARRVQDVDKLVVVAQLSEPGSITASGKVSVPGGAAKTYRFKRVTRNVAAGTRARLRLKLAKRALRAVKHALGNGKRIKARITLTARDRAGNVRTRRVSIRLKP